MNQFVLLIYYLLTILVEDTLSQPIVEIPNLGSVRGSEEVSFKGRKFFAFKGVPYAEPPVGNLRFEEPKPVEPWIGTWEATSLQRCLQKNHFNAPLADPIIGSEDCLYVNIYTPNIETNSNLSVLVFIHGGAFMFGTAHQEPYYILDQNIVFVSLEYRVGPLGFLSTQDNVVPGNNGLKDQILALEWIKANIINFGGNPNSITIMGMSAGGASVHFHFFAEKSRNLFQRAISQSGTLVDPWAMVENPLEKTHVLSSRVGCSTKNNREMVTCLKNRSARQIIQAINELQPWLYNPFTPFGPVVDSWAHNPVIPKTPLDLIRNGQVANKPWICSYTSAEGWYPGDDFYQQVRLDELNTRWNEVLPFILHYNDTVEPSKKDFVSTEIRKYYLKGQNVTFQNYMKFIEIISDRLFVHDIEKTIRYQSKVVTSPIYMYYFAYPKSHERWQGAAHGDDHGLVFKTQDSNKTSDIQMMSVMTRLIGTFVKTGKPMPAWPPILKNDTMNLVNYDIRGPKTMFIRRKTLYRNGQFWETLPFMENEKLDLPIVDPI